MTLCSIRLPLEKLHATKILFLHRRSWVVTDNQNAHHNNSRRGKKDAQPLPITITINSSDLLRARENEPLIRDEMEFTVLEWNSITNQRRAVIESPHSWNPTKRIVTAISHESHLKHDANKHTNRYQSEWRRYKALPVMTKRNACDYWMGDVSISNGFGEWTGSAIPTILNNWFHLRLEWSLCEYLHRDDGLSHSDEWNVWHKEYSSASRWSIEEALKSPNVYSWERDEESTSSDCDVLLVMECIWKIHIGETGHV